MTSSATLTSIFTLTNNKEIDSLEIKNQLLNTDKI